VIRVVCELGDVPGASWPSYKLSIRRFIWVRIFSHHIVTLQKFESKFAALVRTEQVDEGFYFSQFRFSQPVYVLELIETDHSVGYTVLVELARNCFRTHPSTRPFSPVKVSKVVKLWPCAAKK
jgi:hypothetical protein